MSASEPAVAIAGLSAGYGSVPVLRGVDLTIEAGEFVAILGSSGCGKTTLLRAIAGFQPISSGSIHIGGREVSALPPEKRDIAMVFQSYALWPHMTVAGNIGYGLRLRGMPRAAIRSRIGDILGLLGLAGLEDRKVTALSGGQRQRVALGRALAVEPAILLLDEPLSNLDAKVRVQVRSEIRTLQKRLGITALHVTHDREEAMTMADRIVVMEAGRIAQVGTPEEVYDAPASAFVAGFMGADNTLALVVQHGPDGAVDIELPDGEARVRWRRGGDRARGERPDPGPAVGFFRNDAASLTDPGRRASDAIVLDGRVTQRAYPGGHYRYEIEAGNRRLTVTDQRYLDVGATIGLHLPLARLYVFSAQKS